MSDYEEIKQLNELLKQNNRDLATVNHNLMLLCKENLETMQTFMDEKL